jgi:RNA polymerase sigma factor (sigma-70 family)
MMLAQMTTMTTIEDFVFRVVETPRKRVAILVAKHLGLVRKVARKYVKPYERLQIEDTLAYSYGCEGLVKAIQTYRIEFKYKFSTWACLKIERAIIDGYRRDHNHPCKKTQLKFENLENEDLDLIEARDSGFEREEMLVLASQLLSSHPNDTPRDRRDKKILRMFYIDGMSYAQIGKKMRPIITRSGAQLAAARALERIRGQNRKLIREYA